MATISFGGLGNGLDFGQVVDQLVKVARLPVDRLSEKKASLNSKTTDYATLSTKLVALQSAADKLRLATSFDRSSISVSNSAILSATGGSTATSGSYQIEVTKLAQSHQVISKLGTAVTATTTDIVPGGSATFTFKVGSGSDQLVTLSSTATLENLRDQINDLGAGVNASIINTGSDTDPKYRLVLTSTSTGLAKEITISADTTNLSMAATGTGVDILQAAQDAEVKFGPTTTAVTLTRSSNTISDAVPGVTLSLLAKGTAQVNVTGDVNAVKSNITALATAYNEVVKFINERNTYDIATKKGGIFFNEPTVRGILTQIRTALSSSVAGLSSIKTVGEIGFKTERDGTITIDDAKLAGALAANYSGVKSLFINQTASTGIAQLVNNAVDAIDDAVNGPLTLRKNGLTGQITNLTAEIARKEDLLAQYEERLRKQYAALDGLLGRLKSQSSFLQGNSSSR